MAPKHQPGSYWGFPQSGECLKVANEKSTPYMGILVHMTHQAVDGQWQPLVQPFEVNVDLYLSDAAWPYTEPKLDRLGFNGDFNAPMFNSQEGQEFVCQHEAGRNGNVYEKWDMAGTGFQRESADDTEKRRLAAKWKQRGGGFTEQPRGQTQQPTQQDPRPAQQAPPAHSAQQRAQAPAAPTPVAESQTEAMPTGDGIPF